MSQGFGVLILTQGYTALVDAEDFERANAFSWYASPGRRGTGWYAIGTVNGERQQLGRFILGLPKGVTADHINGDGLDNRKANLRAATARQNAHNTCKKRTNTRNEAPSSAFKGVHLDRSSGRWRAQIRCPGGKRLSLGSFLQPEAAARAYDEAARKLFGEFARLNFPAEVHRKEGNASSAA